MPTSPADGCLLVRMNRCELEAYFRAATVAPEPCGYFRGVAIFDPGTRKAVTKSRLAHVVWKGKEFPGDGTMINHTIAGMRAVTARVYVDNSWFDGKSLSIKHRVNTIDGLPHSGNDEFEYLAPIFVRDELTCMISITTAVSASAPTISAPRSQSDGVRGAW